MASLLRIPLWYRHPPPIPPSFFFSPCQVSSNSIPNMVCTGPLYLCHRQGRRYKYQQLLGFSSAYESADSSLSSCEDNKGNDEPRQPNEILEKLRRYGIAGILSYGLLNTAYYLTTFLVVWFYVVPAPPGRMGYVDAVKRFVKLLAMVWAGSQITKLLRAGGALALAPLVDRALSWFTVKFNFESQGKAFGVIVGFCFFLAFMLFLLLTLLCAA